MHAARKLAPCPIENPEVLRRPIRVRLISQREDIAANPLYQPRRRIVMTVDDRHYRCPDEDGRTGSLRNGLLRRWTWKRWLATRRRRGRRLVALREQQTDSHRAHATQHDRPGVPPPRRSATVSRAVPDRQPHQNLTVATS